MILIQLLIFFTAAALEGLEPAEMTFQQLSQSTAMSLHRQEVIVKGFLYRTPSGGIILSSEADLKTCCAGSGANVYKQIYLFSEQPVDALTGIVEVKGLFVYDPIWDAEERVTGLYKIFNAQVSAIEFSWPVGTFAIIGILALCGIFYSNFR